MAIKVHGTVFSTATMRVCACLNEKGLDYEFVPVNMRAGEHKTDNFLSLQLFGQVPAFEDGNSQSSPDIQLLDRQESKRFSIQVLTSELGVRISWKGPLGERLLTCKTTSEL